MKITNPVTGVAPNDADFLVGTANAELTAEIAVGATPGGELGGTWPAPTVDAVHAGSAHHAEAHNLASHATRNHADLLGVGVDDHHAQGHTHASHTGVGTDDHHAQSHTHASHSGIGADDHHHVEAKGRLHSGTVTWTTAFSSTPEVVMGLLETGSAAYAVRVSARSTTGATLNEDTGAFDERLMCMAMETT